MLSSPRQRQGLVAAVVVALALTSFWITGSPGGAAVSPGPVAPETPKAVADVIAAALSTSPLEDNLRFLCDRIGGRPTGSPALERAVDWAIGAFRAAGVDKAGAESYQMPLRWEEGETRINVISPEEFQVDAVSAAWSPPTVPGGLTGPVIDAGNGSDEEIAALAESARGAILLVRQEEMKTLADLFTEYLNNPAVLRRAAGAGASAVLFTSTRPRGLLYRHQQSFDGPGPLPSAIVAREDALRLLRLLEAGTALRLHVDMPNRLGPPFTARNVVAEIRGSQIPDEVVILGGHLDSWELGTGAFDNGANDAMIIDVARSIAACGHRPRRSIRFILFTGEEQGLFGSRAYVKDHEAEMARTKAVVIYDLGVARVRGYFLGGRPELEEPLQRVLKPIESWGVTHHPNEAFVGTDNFDFLLQGVPNLVADQDPAPYLPEYHASSDTLDKVDWRELRVQTAVAAATVWGLADLEGEFGRQLDAAGVAAIIRDQKLRPQMEPFAIWEDYAGGRRGLKPPEGAFP